MAHGVPQVEAAIQGLYTVVKTLPEEIKGLPQNVSMQQLLHIPLPCGTSSILNLAACSLLSHMRAGWGAIDEVWMSEGRGP